MVCTKKRIFFRWSIESEYKALANIVVKLTWLKHCCTNLWCDNLGATSVSVNSVFHARTKHVEAIFHFVLEMVAKQKLFVQCVHQAATFTKVSPFTIQATGRSPTLASEEILDFEKMMNHNTILKHHLLWSRRSEQSPIPVQLDVPLGKPNPLSSTSKKPSKHSNPTLFLSLGYLIPTTAQLSSNYLRPYDKDNEKVHLGFVQITSLAIFTES
ncbi:hypothetical protein OSB04_021702 [Centaurea solstitialis]|uniref:Mitochondrial protein n=1 Tax=Centaurea solstitialis TaxID=347529 RepID=A0AA38SWB1_9ASTR|nr:hypothetical protein OSB04_021702 [Centaurea solstitialis]